MGAVGGDRRTYVRSMTGFATASRVVDGVSLDVELRGLNSRYLDIHFRGVRLDGAQERRIRDVLRQAHFRGKIDIVVSLTEVAFKETLDGEKLEHIDTLVSMYTSLCKRYGAGDAGLSRFLSSLLLGGATGFKTELKVQGGLEDALFDLIEATSLGLHESRSVEGSGLYEDIVARLGHLSNLARDMVATNEGMRESVFTRLRMRLEAFCSDIHFDESRLEQEALILADKADVSEELVRLKIHIERCMVTLQTQEYAAIGRQLDFIVQEIARELNTIGSKAQDATMQGLVIDAKSELEKIREQVQNVE